MKEALEVRFDSDAGDNLTVRQYLHRLLKTLWTEQERFSGKRPFGNGGWDFDVYFALAKAGLVDLGEADEYGDYNDITRKQEELAHKYVLSLIDEVFSEETTA